MEYKLSLLVSIVVPCYNQAQYLPEALNSVLQQTYANWECIIVNDGATDDTEQVAKQYVEKDGRFKYFFQQNGGLSAARNTGISSAAGEYILPLDADDLISPKYLELGVKAFTSNPKLALIYAEARKFGIENEPWMLPSYNYINLLLSNCIFCSAIFKKSLWEQNGGYDVELKNGWEDWAFWIKILSADDEVHQIPQVLFHYRTKVKSMIKSISAADQEQVKWHIYNNNKEVYKTHFPSPITLILENNYLKNHIKKVMTSNSYVLGNKLIRPLAKLKKLFRRN